MKKYPYGHRPPNIGPTAFGLGWLTGVRHIVSRSAKVSQWHQHAEHSVIFCLRGEFAYEFENLPPTTLIAGSFLVIPRNLRHRHAQAIDPAGLRLEMLMEPQKAKGAAYAAVSANLATESIRALVSRPIMARPCPPSVMANVRALDTLAADSEQGLDSVALARARLLASLILLDCTHAEDDIKPTGNDLIAQITPWMEEHLAEKFRINHLVAHLGYSRTHVFSLFRQATGLTPADFLTKLRIRKAMELLRTTDLPAHEIGMRCGFSSSTVFNATFKRKSGLTPIAWRKKN